MHCIKYKYLPGRFTVATEPVSTCCFGGVCASLMTTTPAEVDTPLPEGAAADVDGSGEDAAFSFISRVTLSNL